MTIPAGETSISQWTGNGSADTFDYEFKIAAKGELKVTTTDTAGTDTVLTVDVDYSVAGIGQDGGGQITLTAGALANQYTITLEDNVQVSQETPYGNQSAFFGKSHENSFDKLTRLIKRAFNNSVRAILIPGSTPTTFNNTLPTTVAGRLVGINETNTGVDLFSAAEVANIAGYGAAIEDYYRDGFEFTAGSTTQLTLSASPGYKANTTVHFDGVYQSRASYSLSGATITFTSAIPYGVSEVSVWHGETLAVGTIGSDNVTNQSTLAGDTVTEALTSAAYMKWKADTGSTNRNMAQTDVGYVTELTDDSAKTYTLNAADIVGDDVVIWFYNAQANTNDFTVAAGTGSTFDWTTLNLAPGKLGGIKRKGSTNTFMPLGCWS